MKKGHFPVRFSIGLGLSATICFFILGTFYFLWSLTFDLKDVGKIPERSLVYDMDGKVYSRLFGENRILVETNGVSPLFKKALLAREDGPAPPDNPMSADRVRWEHIQRVYELCGHNVSETARRLNMHRRTLQRILAKRAPK